MSAEQGRVAAVSRNGAYTFTKPTRDEIVLLAGLGVEGDVHAGITVRHRHRVALDPTQPNLRQVHLIHAELFEEVAGKGYEVAAGDLGENVTTSGIDLLGLPRGTILRFGGAGEAGSGEADSGETGSPEAASRKAGLLEPASAEAGVTGAGRAVDGVLAAAAAATLDDANARATEAVAEAADRDAGYGDNRPAIVLAGLRNPCLQINKFRSGLLKEALGRDERGNLVRKAGVMAVVLRGGPIRPGDPVAVELPPGPHAALEKI